MLVNTKYLFANISSHCIATTALEGFEASYQDLAAKRNGYEIGLEMLCETDTR